MEAVRNIEVNLKTALIKDDVTYVRNLFIGADEEKKKIIRDGIIAYGATKCLINLRDAYLISLKLSDIEMIGCAMTINRGALYRTMYEYYRKIFHVSINESAFYAKYGMFEPALNAVKNASPTVNDLDFGNTLKYVVSNFSSDDVEEILEAGVFKPIIFDHRYLFDSPTPVQSHRVLMNHGILFDNHMLLKDSVEYCSYHVNDQMLMTLLDYILRTNKMKFPVCDDLYLADENIARLVLRYNYGVAFVDMLQFYNVIVSREILLNFSERQLRKMLKTDGRSAVKYYDFVIYTYCTGKSRHHSNDILRSLRGCPTYTKCLEIVRSELDKDFVMKDIKSLVDAKCSSEFERKVCYWIQSTITDVEIF